MNGENPDVNKVRRKEKYVHFGPEHVEAVLRLLKSERVREQPNWPKLLLTILGYMFIGVSINSIITGIIIERFGSKSGLTG